MGTTPLQEYNEWADYTIQELYEAREKLEERLEVLEAAPINYYSAGYYDTYLAAMSQMWGIQGCRDDIAAISEEIAKRYREGNDDDNTET